MDDILKEPGAFCEVFGDTLRNRMLTYICTWDQLEFCVPDMAEDLEISRPTVYEFIKELERKGMIKPSRVIEKTQLYKLNRDNIKAQVLRKSFLACLDMITKEYEQKEMVTQTKRVSAVAEKKSKYKK